MHVAAVGSVALRGRLPANRKAAHPALASARTPGSDAIAAVRCKLPMHAPGRVVSPGLRRPRWSTGQPGQRLLQPGRCSRAPVHGPPHNTGYTEPSVMHNAQ